MSDIYEDLEMITMESGIMTHMIPRVMQAVKPWLQEKVTEAIFWGGKFDQTHTGEFELPIMASTEQAQVFKLFSSLPSPLFKE